MSSTCTCSPSILDPLCPVREHAVMAKAVSVARDFLGEKKMAVSFAPAVIIPIDFSPPPYVPQAVRLDWKNCTCTSIAADPFCPIEEHRALAAPGDGQPFDENPAHPIEQLLRAGTLPEPEKP
jgi:hypothetical protein